MIPLTNEDMFQVQALLPANQEAFYQLLGAIEQNNIDADHWELYRRYKAICLIRFLRSRQWNASQAFQNFLTCLEWRRREQIDDYPNRLQYNENAQMLLKCFPARLHGEDREGIPVYFERLGSVDIKSVFTAIPNEADWVLYHVLQLENACMAVAETYTRLNKPFNGIIVVEDMLGLSFRHWYLPAIHILRKLLSIDMNYYPEMLQRVFVVNAPSAFWVMWKLVRPMMDQYTLEKVFVSGNDLTTLQQFVDPRSLPELYGGYCSCPNGTIKNGGALCANPRQYSAVSNDSMQVVVGRSSVHEVPVIVDKGYVLSWEFATENDISFGVMREMDGLPRQVVVPFKKIEIHNQKVSGFLVISQPATYILVWDNSHSFLRSKKLALKYHVEEYKTMDAPLVPVVEPVRQAF